MNLRAVVACILLTTAGTRMDPSNLIDEIDASAGQGAVDINGRNTAESADTSPAAGPEEGEVEYSRADLCGTGQASSSSMNADCTGYADGTPLPVCEGTEPLPPLWRRTRAAATDEWTTWTLAQGWVCPEDALPELTVTDFRRLPLAPSVLNIQPARPQVLVNMPTIVYTEPTTQTFTTTLLGYPVEVEATPTTFTWDFGDDTDPITTTSPGHPYPDHDIAQPYTRAGTYTITLTTTHTGRYRMAGTTPWLAVAGTATTTTLSGPIEAIEAPTHLVADDCITNPHGPYC
jgi:hypothetical protein